MDEIKEFQNKILNWYQENMRDLPWRKTTDPYHILVSEVMLQQTQVSRVVDYYNRWLKEFPAPKDLAKTNKKKVLKLWSGLGYNNRALRLKKSAVKISKEGFPKTLKKLQQLPGVGPYTASAIMAFAFNEDVAVVDTNIRRIFIHEFDLSDKISHKELEDIAFKVLPKGKARVWYNALMDYGSIVLTAKKTGVEPVSKQSKFKGSVREVRGFIVKQLTKSDSVSIDYLKQNFELSKIAKAVQGLQNENVVEKNGKVLKLA